MQVLRVLLIAVLAAAVLPAQRAAAAPLFTFTVEGTFGAPTAGFPFQDIASYDATFTVDAVPEFVAGFSQYPLTQTSFTFFDSLNAPIHAAGFSYPDAELRVGANFLGLFLGPGVTGPDDPSDFRIFFTGAQFATGTAVLPSIADILAGTFSSGFAEAGFAPDFEESPVTSAHLTFVSSTVPEPTTVSLLAMAAFAGLATRHVSHRRRRGGQP